MERKFESELAGQVARRHRNPLRSRAKVLVMTLVSCAVMVAAAGAVLSMKASAETGGPTEYQSLLTGGDYLVKSEAGDVVYTATVLEDDDFLIKRTSELKAVEFDTPGNSAVDYTKWAYSVNLRVRDLEPFAGGIGGMIVSEVTVGDIGEMRPWISVTGFTINGVQVMEASGLVSLDYSKYVGVEYVDGTMVVTVTLPDLTDLGISYGEEDMVSVFVLLKTPYIGWVGDPLLGWVPPVSEVGFPEYQF